MCGCIIPNTVEPWLMAAPLLTIIQKGSYLGALLWQLSYAFNRRPKLSSKRYIWIIFFRVTLCIQPRIRSVYNSILLISRTKFDFCNRGLCGFSRTGDAMKSGFRTGKRYFFSHIIMCQPPRNIFDRASTPSAAAQDNNLSAQITLRSGCQQYVIIHGCAQEDKLYPV